MLLILLGVIVLLGTVYNIAHMGEVSTLIGMLDLLITNVFTIIMGAGVIAWGLIDCKYKAPRLIEESKMSVSVAQEVFKNTCLKVVDEEPLWVEHFVEEIERNWLWSLGVWQKNREFYIVHLKEGTVKIEL